jgi:hypothetical protein
MVILHLFKILHGQRDAWKALLKTTQIIALMLLSYCRRSSFAG